MVSRLRLNSALLLMALLSIFAVAPLFYPGFFFGQSGLAAVYNLADFRQNPSFSWRPGLGLDSSFGDFTLLPYYLGALLTGVGLSSVAAVKLLYGAGFILSSIGSYALVSAAFRGYPSSIADRAAVLSGVVYTYLPYHLASTYVRADLGESLAFGLVPWAGLCLWQLAHWRLAGSKDEVPQVLAKHPHPNRLPQGEGILSASRREEMTLTSKSTGEGAALTSPSGRGRPSETRAGEGVPEAGIEHAARERKDLEVGGLVTRIDPSLPNLALWLALSSLLVVGLLLAYSGSGLLVLLVLGGVILAAVMRLPDRSPLLSGAVAVAAPLVVGLAVAWPLAPPLSSSATAAGGTEGLQMIEFSRFFSPVWVDEKGPAQGLPVQIGLVAIALAILSFLPASAGDLLGNNKGSIKYCQVVSLVLVVLMLPPLAPAWSVLGPLVGEPFRLLFVAALPVSVLAGSMLLRKGLMDPLAAVSLVMLAVLGSYGYLLPRFGTLDEPLHIVAGRVGDDIVLLDYRLTPGGTTGSPSEVERGSEVRLRLVWQALRPPKEDLTVFTHLLDSSQQIRGQHDGQPAAGARPTSKWQAGDVVVDEHVLRVDPDAPAGDYVIEVGMYALETGKRMPISIRGQVDTRALLAGLKVKG